MYTVITGASKGIGREIALKFGREGHNLALCARNLEALSALKAEITTMNPQANVIIKSVDISRKEEVVSFGNAIIKEFGHIDVLVNNGGVFLPGLLLEEQDGQLENMIHTNLYSAYHLTRVIAPTMLAKRSGHIFNMCSVASQMAYPNGGSYSISKFALLGFTKVLREELKTAGIKVTAILPGATWSDSWAGVDLPYERLMEAKDIADTIWSAYQLGPSAVVEEIVLRPQLGDL